MGKYYGSLGKYGGILGKYSGILGILWILWTLFTWIHLGSLEFTWMHLADMGELRDMGDLRELWSENEGQFWEVGDESIPIFPVSRDPIGSNNKTVCRTASAALCLLIFTKKKWLLSDSCV